MLTLLLLLLICPASYAQYSVQRVHCVFTLSASQSPVFGMKDGRLVVLAVCQPKWP